MYLCIIAFFRKLLLKINKNITNLGRGGWQRKSKTNPLVEDVGENVGEDEDEDHSDPGGEKVKPPRK